MGHLRLGLLMQFEQVKCCQLQLAASRSRAEPPTAPSALARWPGEPPPGLHHHAAGHPPRCGCRAAAAQRTSACTLHRGLSADRRRHQRHVHTCVPSFAKVVGQLRATLRPSQQAATKSCLGLSGSAVTAVLRRARCNCAPASFAGRVPCALEPNANLHAFATPGRKSWRDPPHASLCCVPKQGCFRAVLDGAVDLSPGTAGIRLEEKVLAVLKTELGVNEFVRFDTGRYKEYTAGDSGVYNDARLLRAGRKMTMAECELWAVGHDDRGCRPHQWSAMHADYFESARCGARTRTPWGIDPEGQRSGFGAVQCK